MRAKPSRLSSTTVCISLGSGQSESAAIPEADSVQGEPTDESSASFGCNPQGVRKHILQPVLSNRLQSIDSLDLEADVALAPPRKLTHSFHEAHSIKAVVVRVVVGFSSIDLAIILVELIRFLAADARILSLS